MFSLCIPTMNRFEDFLKIFLPKYLTNPLISEIIICDETGEDARKIREDSSLQSTKIRLHVNEKRLGPLKNKLKTMGLAVGQWLALIDSDNFADEDYFIAAKTFIEKRNVSTNSILAPTAANPGTNMAEYSFHNGFNFRAFAGLNVNIEFFKTMTEEKFRRHSQLILLFNTGNFVLHKNLLNTLKLSSEDLEKTTDFFDVLFFNTLLFEQIPGLNFYVVPKMSYTHTIHNGSITMQSQATGLRLLEEFKPRFFALRQQQQRPK